MSRRLLLPIAAGEHTCRDGAEGPWCPFVRVSLWAHKSSCHLFNKRLSEVNQDGTPRESAGWLGRLPECKAAEVRDGVD